MPLDCLKEISVLLIVASRVQRSTPIIECTNQQNMRGENQSGSFDVKEQVPPIYAAQSDLGEAIVSQ